MDFALWLARELEDRNLTQRELARRAGISHTSVADVISQRRDPTFDFCAAIAGPLGESEWMIFQRAGLVPDDVPPLEDKSLRHIIQRMRPLTQDERNQVMAFAEWLYRRRDNNSQT